MKVNNHREIKFRAFDAFRSMWICEGYHVIGEVTMFGLIDQHVEESRKEIQSLEYYNHIIESQFIGITDKNGKEIYEGDIIGMRTKDGIVPAWEVVYHSKYASFRPRDIKRRNPDSAQTGLNFWRNHEVIGNVFSNPEMLL